MRNVRHLRNGVACAFLVLTAIYLNTTTVHAAGCSGPTYLQDGVICEAHYACTWASWSGTEYWESEEGSPRCTWFNWTDFDLWMYANFGSTQTYTYGWQCYDNCPPYFGDCGTNGSVNIAHYWEGTCPG